MEEILNICQSLYELLGGTSTLKKRYAKVYVENRYVTSEMVPFCALCVLIGDYDEDVFVNASAKEGLFIEFGSNDEFDGYIERLVGIERELIKKSKK